MLYFGHDGPDALPDDPGTLKAMVLAERARAERLEQIIKELQRHRFGRRAETLPEDQLLLGLEEVDQIEAGEEAAGEAQMRRPSARGEPRRAGRTEDRFLPICRVSRCSSISRDMPARAAAAPCIGSAKIGPSGSTSSPPSSGSWLSAGPNMPAGACEDVVVQAPAPARLIEGGIPTEATVAQVLVSKYADHLPLYRQAQIYARQGVNLDRSTLADWVGRAAFLLRPVHERLLASLKSSAKLFADETTAPVLDPGRGRTKTGQLFAYARDDRPWGGTDPPGVAYVYAPDRKAERPIAHLAGFVGVLQVDGYGGYRVLAERERGHARLLLGPCPPPLLRTRRRRPGADRQRSRWHASLRSTPSRRTSAAAAPTSGATVRQERSRPILDDLEPWLRAKLDLISQKTKLAEAIRYALSRWQGLTRFLDDGRIEIDSNVVERSDPSDRSQSQERALRGFRRRRRALGRSSPRSSRPASCAASIRYAYLADVITQDRQRPSQQPHRRSPAMGLSRRTPPQGRGLKTSLTFHPIPQ